MNSTVEGWRALVVPVDGDLRDVVLSTTEHGLPDLRRHTGGEYVEHTRGGDGLSAWVDEDGALGPEPRPVNGRLTRWANRLDDWQLHGDAVITGPVDADGEITSLTRDQVAHLREVLT